MMHAPIKAIDRTNDSLVRLPEVIRQTGLSRTTIYRKAKAGTFPAPEQMSDNAVGWWASDLAAWKAAPMMWRAAA
jgi:prophage regulatory protein